MKERPILFSAPMVRAILEGRKTQTRRVVKEAQHGKSRACPYGAPGDLLWVRETWGVWHDCYVEDLENEPTFWRADYTAADENSGVMPRWRPSIHMPRARSRVNLQVTGVRVERLQEMSGADATAEGIYELWPSAWHWQSSNVGAATPYVAFRTLWESINGAKSWAANPWVWVVEFKRVTP